MTGLEPRTSDIRSDRSATTTVTHLEACLLALGKFKQIFFSTKNCDVFFAEVATQVLVNHDSQE